MMLPDAVQRVAKLTDKPLTVIDGGKAYTFPVKVEESKELPHVSQEVVIAESLERAVEKVGNNTAGMVEGALERVGVVLKDAVSVNNDAIASGITKGIGAVVRELKDISRIQPKIEPPVIVEKEATKKPIAYRFDVIRDEIGQITQIIMTPIDG